MTRINHPVCRNCGKRRKGTNHDGMHLCSQCAPGYVSPRPPAEPTFFEQVAEVEVILAEANAEEWWNVLTPSGGDFGIYRDRETADARAAKVNGRVVPYTLNHSTKYDYLEKRAEND